jgi:hypothetical protein
MFEVMAMGLSWMIGLVALVVLTDSVMRWLSAYQRLNGVLQSDVEADVLTPRAVVLPRARPATTSPFGQVHGPIRAHGGIRKAA